MRNINPDEMSLGTRRTLKNLRKSLTELLQEKPFEKISIQELCDKAMISRGTFYNYFYDKYDLLNYDWEQLQLKIDPKLTHSNIEFNDYQEYMNLLLQNLINYLSKERNTYEKIINHNKNSIFFINMHEYIENQILIILEAALSKMDKPKIPLDLISTVYANTIIAIGRWWLKSGEEYTKEEVYKFFTILIERNLILY